MECFSGFLRQAVAKQNTMHYFRGWKLMPPLSILTFSSSENFNEDILWHTKSLSKKKTHKYSYYVPSKDIHSLGTVYISNTLTNPRSVSSGSVAKSCLTLCDPMDRIMPGFPVLPHLLEFVQIHACLSSQWCHPTTSSSLFPFHPAFNLSQHQSLFQWVGSSY